MTYCRLCEELSDEEIGVYLDKLLLKESHRLTSVTERQQRLTHCDACPYRMGRTCTLNGRLVAFLASVTDQHCPKQLWDMDSSTASSEL